MNAILVLWYRQIIRHLRSRSRVIGSLGQPILYLLALGYGLGPTFSKAGQGNYLDFLAPGIIGMAIIFTAIFQGMEIIWDRQFGFLKETLVAPVSRFNIMVGRTLGGATVSSMQGVIVFLIALVAGFRPTSWANVPAAFLVILLIAFMFTAFGTALASRLADMQGFQLIMNFLVMPLFFLSGALFPLQGLPPTISLIAALDPLSYGVDALRILLATGGHYGLGTDFVVLSGISVLFLVVGSYQFSKIQV